MRVGLIAMSGVRVKNPELVAFGVTLPQFVNRGKVIASLPSLRLAGTDSTLRRTQTRVSGVALECAAALIANLQRDRDTETAPAGNG